MADGANGMQIVIPTRMFGTYGFFLCPEYAVSAIVDRVYMPWGGGDNCMPYTQKKMGESRTRNSFWPPSING